jgi:hypothetical protein
MDFAVWFENRIGLKNYEYLKKAANAVIKWSPAELETLYKDTLEAYVNRTSQNNDQKRDDNKAV